MGLNLTGRVFSVKNTKTCGFDFVQKNFLFFGLFFILIFAECWTLPSARKIALGKDRFADEKFVM